ncbi:MAG: transporter substrate-binding domain-containing protein [Mesorhizobium sp.]|uniref:transporter substrate-binding domain-containing protein n=1 Tax=unclassified Mesorhizobium TaxID=325217 RepID=UPI000F754F2F|nr:MULTISPECIES: transporter substrate-binding domain-containing protein [unclassified Mesorhizobium]RVD69955.1 transporter substrate-binding domain-containing protein [Mesorhizobium sp. M4A.F.Ca.ET.029.04.2.1]AZO51942.1 transporter substrate-binding domain-containing protein [Mesorhizobium sp. M4B.F.Ca.ET.058.02.1.1]RUX48775.1 transporter substrate-binding domain-containing protein [Mesorhizobium sp. M4A.F.Ca.ET.050.02.1.1]RVC44718.1 transporter substrate-binding domain-containing protein [Mes
MLVAAQSFAGMTFAAEPQVPVLWDAKERLPKPDLSALPRLRFLTTTDFPPFNFLDGGGRLSGFHVDLARAICAELGIAEKCQIQALPWGELDEALQKGEGEAIIAGIAATAETRSKYAFSRSYLQFPARFIMPKAKAFTEPILDKLRSKRVGVVAGSAHEKMLRDYFGTVQVVPFDTPETLYGDLKAGKIDAAFGDGMRFAFWLGGTDAAGCCRFAGGPYLAPEYLGSGMAIATRAGDPALAAAMDYALQEISVKGTFAEFYLRYFPVSFF